MKNKNKDKIKIETDFSDIVGTMTLTSAISLLSTLESETLEFNSMKNKNLLKDFEKLRFKKIK